MGFRIYNFITWLMMKYTVNIMNLFQGVDAHLLVSHYGKSKRALRGPFYKGTNLIHGGLQPHDLNTFQKPPSCNTVTLRVRISTCGFWRDTKHSVHGA